MIVSTYVVLPHRVLSWMDRHYWIIIPSKTKASPVRKARIEKVSKTNESFLSLEQAFAFSESDGQTIRFE